jgi:uncharacterized protein with von Willebrand factor type A (vWA) domain
MLASFFVALRAAGIPVSLTEYLTLLEALAGRVAAYSVDDFYALGRTVLVKDERHYDRYDRVFGKLFHGIESAFAGVQGESAGTSALPPDWLRRRLELALSPEERARIESLGGFAALIAALKDRLATQTHRHEGGSHWIGTGGTSPFGADGYQREGVRMGQGSSRHRRAAKVWERREFANLSDTVELGTRNIKLALRRLRRFARQGAALELDLPDTIDATARNAGYLELRMVPERHNALKVLLFLDVGGSMDEHVHVCEELFSAARSEFKHLEHFYFHNFLYESVWRDNRRRHSAGMPLPDLLRTYRADYRLIFLGDATMSPYEIAQTGGSIEHWNDEPGAVWMQRVLAAYPRHVWLNPTPEERWQHVASIQLTRELLGGRMFPLTLAGLDGAIRALSGR